MSNRSVGWHAIVTLAGQWAKYVVQILALVLFSRLLDPHEFGIVAMVTAVAGVAWVIGDFGLSIAAISAPSLTDGQRNNLFWITTLVGVLIGGAVAGAGPLLAMLYGEQQVRAVAAALGLVFVANGLSGQFRTELNRALRFEWLAAADVSGQVFGLLAGLVTILAGHGLWGLVVQQVGAAVVTLLVVVLAARWWPGLPRRGEEMSGLLKFGALALGGGIAQYISVNADQILIGRTWGAATVGVYNRAFQVARMPAQQVGAPLTRVVVPHLVARLDDPPRFLQAIRRGQGVLGAALICLFAFLAALAPDILRIALGPGWGGAVPFVRVLCLAGAIEAASRVFYWAALAHGRPGLLFGAELAARAVMVALMAFVVQFGAVWVAWAAVVGQVLLLISNAWVVAPAAGIAPWPVLRIAGAVTAVVGPATALVMVGRAAVDDLPLVVSFLAFSALWLALCSPWLLLAGVRDHLRESLRFARARSWGRG